MIKFTEQEIVKMQGDPGALKALANIHDLDITMGEAMDMDCTIHHDRQAELMAEYHRISQEWEGYPPQHRGDIGMELLDAHLAAREAVHKYFGYTEDYRVISIDDAREYYWRLRGEGPGEVAYATDPEAVGHDSGEYYVNEIYTQRFLPKWVYRGKDYTMICVDTRTDGNKFLQIFSNDKEIKE